MKCRNEVSTPTQTTCGSGQKRLRASNDHTAHRCKPKSNEDRCGVTTITIDEDSEEGAECALGEVLLARVSSLEYHRPLRISAGCVAAAAGLNPFVDIGELFLELLYQDLPHLLKRDADLVGVELLSPTVERAHLLEKSGEADSLEAALKYAHASSSIEGTRSAQTDIGRSIAMAESTKRLSTVEAKELRRILEKEVNREFGSRHENAALQAYEERTGWKVYARQQRISLSLPTQGSEHNSNQGHLFSLTGFIDGLVDEPTSPSANSSAPSGASETLVVEVKHRMHRIKEPPEIYDIIQLCTYCRALGLSKGDLVQCLRGADGLRGTIHITRVDFSEGAAHHRGWEQHILPSLYAITKAVYKAREDEGQRYRLLASGSDDRIALVGELCPHLAK